MTEDELKRIARTEVDRLKSEVAKRDTEAEKLRTEIARLKKWNKWFFYRVKFMRQCQKEYFRLRMIQKSKKATEQQKEQAAEEARDWFQKSKDLEKEVDDEILRVTDVSSRQDAISELKKEFGELDEVKLANSEHGMVKTTDQDLWSPKTDKR